MIDPGFNIGGYTMQYTTHYSMSVILVCTSRTAQYKSELHTVANLSQLNIVQ